MKQIIKKEGLPDVVFHSLRHTSVTYKLKLSKLRLCHTVNGIQTVQKKVRTDL